MKNKEKGTSKIEVTTSQSKPEETGLETEQGLNMKIAVKSYQEPARHYFSSPCMLSELEDKEDMFNF